MTRPVVNASGGPAVAQPIPPVQPQQGSAATVAAAREAACPLAFSAARPPSAAAGVYLGDPAVRKLVAFFEAKGLAALKDEDRREQWYEDWLAYQAGHRLYAAVLAPKQYSTLGGEFDLLRYARFLEAFAYFSPAHGYSLQVTSLALFSILMGANADLKREAVAALEAGGLLAFGVSERAHGSDLLGNEFAIREIEAGRFKADGAKYYVGNANAASIISVLARKEDRRSAWRSADGARRAPFALFALRPGRSNGFGRPRKIRTFGVRAGFVGEFEVKGHDLPASDLIADGRGAWDAVRGAVTLGKFFLGFGSVGICEHAFAEAADHLGRRILYGKPAAEMPHIRSLTAQAYARLTAMKLYAYRALDYLHAAGPDDRRYLLYAAVQKAKVSTEGVKVMALLSECVGAKGFESDTYFEMALRDVQLIPGLEGSTHLNLALAAQFIPRYFARRGADLADPGSLAAGEVLPRENPYLTEARAGAASAVEFPHYLKAYRPLAPVPNVRRFVRQARAFRLFSRGGRAARALKGDPATTLELGQCLAAIAYAQLVAENSARLGTPGPVVSAMFHSIVHDLSVSALSIASSPRLDAAGRALIRQVVAVPRTTAAEWESVSARAAGAAGA